MENARKRRVSIISPDLPPIEVTRQIAASDLRSRLAIENAIFENTSFQAAHHSGLTLQGVRFLHVHGSDSKFDNLKLLDSIHDSCDWANASWNHAMVNRCALDGCRMTGFSAADAKFQNTRFKKCKLDLSIFHRTEFASCSFENCMLCDSSFEEAKFQDVIFKDCDLRNVRMVRARFEEVDFRGSSLEGLQAEPRDVRGVTIDPSQAIHLIHLLGVRVQKIDHRSDQKYSDKSI
jgi:uncharacterized protein YjbI with pentapeptide repeats